MGDHTVGDGLGNRITVDGNGHHVNTTSYDWTHGITTDRQEMASAAKYARYMIEVLEAGAKRAGGPGFNEQDCLSLLESFLIVGQWSRGSGYARSVSMHFTFHRTPRSLGPGRKVSGLLLFWLKRFESSFDPKDRRQAFNEIQALMFDFVWSFHLGLLKKDGGRVTAFEKDLHALVKRDWARTYRFNW